MSGYDLSAPGYLCFAKARREFQDGLIRDVFPLVESNYRTRPGRQFRAIAGYSMGAFQALWFGLDHPEAVGGLGIFGGGIWGEEGRADVVTFAARSKYAFRPFIIRVGDRDMNRTLSDKLDAALTDHRISRDYRVLAGAGHTWPTWRQCLIEILPLMFPKEMFPKERILP